MVPTAECVGSGGRTWAPQKAWLQVSVREGQRNGCSRSWRGLYLPGQRAFWNQAGQNLGILQPVGKELRKKLGSQGKWEPE